MLELILLSPLIGALVLTGLDFAAWRKRPVTPRRWFGMVLWIAAALALPLAIGVWPLDFFGQDVVVGEAESPSGHRIEIVQRWNFIDFYSTEAHVVSSDGRRAVTTLDGDDSKHWLPVSIPLGADGRSAMISLRAGHSRLIPGEAERRQRPQPAAPSGDGSIFTFRAAGTCAISDH